MTANTRFRPDYSQGRPYEVSTPSAGDILIEAAKMMRQDYQTGLDRAERGYEAEQKRKQYETELGFKTRAEGREIDQINRDRLKEQYQADAVSATLDPERFKVNKIANERRALDASIAGLPQTERESILKQYDPTVSGNQWVSSTIASPYVNQSDLVKTKSADMDMKLKDPNSKEYKDALNAELEAAKKKSDISVAGQLRVINEKEKLDKARENREMRGLLEGLTAETTRPVERVVSSNNDLIKGVKEANEALDLKATAYGENYKSILENDPKLKDIETRIKLSENIINNPDKNPVGTISALTKNKEMLEVLRDKRIGELDEVAKKELGIKNADIYSRREVPKLIEDTVVEQKPLSREEWINSAIKQTGSDISPKVLDAITKRADAIYPKVDQKALIEARKDDMTANDYRELISKSGKTPVSKSLEGLKTEFEAISNKSKDSGGYGVGMESLSVMNRLGIDDDHKKRIVEAARTRRVTDKDLAKAIEASEQNRWFSGGVEADILKQLELMPLTNTQQKN